MKKIILLFFILTVSIFKITGQSTVYSSDTNAFVSKFLPKFTGKAIFNAGFNVINGYVGIGTTAPTQKLNVVGQGVFGSSSPSYDTGDGFGSATRIGYSTSGDYGYIIANNTGIAGKNLILQPTGAGTNVGVGTLAPNYKLDVTGAVRSDKLIVGNNVDNGNILQVTGISSLMGNVGVGTIVPVAIFGTTTHINGASGASLNLTGTTSSGYLTASDALGAVNLSSNNTLPLSFTVNSSEKMRILSTGNVGIGTTTPNAKVEVFNGSLLVNVPRTATGTIIPIAVGTQRYTGLANSGLAGMYHVESGSGGFGQAGSLAFYTSADDVTGTEKLRITNLGNVGIGTLAPLGTLQIGDLNSIGKLNDVVLFAPSNGVGTGNSIKFDMNVGGGVTRSRLAEIQTLSYQGAGYNQLRFNLGTWNNSAVTSNVMTLQDNGFVGIGNIAPVTKLDISGTAHISDGVGTRTRLRTGGIIDFATIGQGSYADGAIMANNLSLFGNNGTGMYVNSSGNILINSNTDNGNKLQVNGNTSITGNLGINAGAFRFTNLLGGLGEFGRISAYNTIGTVGEASSVAFIRDAMTDGNYGAVTINTFGSERIRIGSNGFVGIGTTAPVTNLDVVGGVNASSAYYVAGTQFAANGTNGSTNVNARVIANSNGTGGYADGMYIGFGNSANGTTRIYDGGTTNSLLLNNATVSTAGFTKFLFGTQTDTGTSNQFAGDIESKGFLTFTKNSQTLPNSKLGGAIYSNKSGGNGEINFLNTYDANAASTAFIFSNKTGAATSTDLMTIMRGGNVGIGTSLPLAKLHTYTLGLGDKVGLIVGRDGSQTGDKLSVVYNSQDLGDQASISSIATALATADLSFSTRVGSVLTEKVRILSSGNVGIGTTAPSEKVEIAGNINLNTASPLLRYNWSGIASFNTGIYGTATTDSRYSIYSGSTATEVLSVKYLNGFVGIGTTTPTSSLEINGILTTGDIKIKTSTSRNLYDNSTDNIYLNARVLQNSSTTNQDGMYIGYANSGGAATRIFDGGGTNALSVSAGSFVSNGFTKFLFGTQTDDGTAVQFASNVKAKGTLRTNSSIAMDVNNNFIYMTDASGIGRRMMGLSTNNVLYVGDVDNTIVGSQTLFTTNTNHLFYINGLEKARFIQNGNFGLNITAPRLKMEISATTIVPTALSVVTADGNLLLSDGGNLGVVHGISNYNSSYQGYVQARNNTASSIAYNYLINPLGGNVGIGTTAPTSTVHNNGSEANSIITISAATTLGDVYYVIANSATSYLITLPAVASCVGRTYAIKALTGSKTVTAFLNSAGTSTTTLNAGTITYITSDGTNWQQF